MASKKRKYKAKRKPARRRVAKKRGRKYSKVACRIGSAALQYARVKGYLSGIEKYMSDKKRGKSANPEGEDRVIARWETKGNDWIELRKSPSSLRIPLVDGGDGYYHYRGRNMGGGIPNYIKTDEQAIEYMERPWGRGGAGPATVLKTDRPSLRRVKSSNPKLRPFAGAKGHIQYPFWEVLGRRFADQETAHVFAQQKALDTGAKVEVWYKPDTWTAIMRNYAVDPEHMKSYNPPLSPRQVAEIRRVYRGGVTKMDNDLVDSLLKLGYLLTPQRGMQYGLTKKGRDLAESMGSRGRKASKKMTSAN